MKKGLTARSLRLILIAAMTLIVISTMGGFYLVQNILRDYALETQAMNAKASSSDSNVQTLQLIKKRLDASHDVIDRTNKIVAESKSYQYQDEIVRDITSYALKSKLTVQEFSFQASGAAAATPPTSTPAAPLTSTSGTAAQSTLKSTIVNISIKSPVSYTDLLNFIQLIEGNLTKMQISSVSLTKSTDTNSPPGYVDSQGFTIEVYIK